MDAKKDLEVMRLELEIANVDAHRRGMLFKMREREIEISELSASVAVQDSRISELGKMITKLKEG